MDKRFGFMNFVQVDDALAEIEIYGGIGETDWETWKEKNTILDISPQLNELRALGVQKIVVKIDSFGGYLNEALSIYDALRSHPAEIETRVTGMTASAATVIFMAGDKRVISDNALFLVHKCSNGCWGNANEQAANLEDLRLLDAMMKNIYLNRGSVEASVLDELMEVNNGAGKWITGKDAFDLGFATELAGEATAAVACGLTSKICASMGYSVPDVLQGAPSAANLDEDAVEERLFTKLYNKLKGLFTNEIKEKTVINETEKEMKKFSAAFVALFALSCFADRDYDPEAGVVLSENEALALDTKVSELVAEGETKDKELETLRSQVAEKDALLAQATNHTEPKGDDTKIDENEGMNAVLNSEKHLKAIGEI